jgi:hypothetical protein
LGVIHLQDIRKFVVLVLLHVNETQGILPEFGDFENIVTAWIIVTSADKTDLYLSVSGHYKEIRRRCLDSCADNILSAYYRMKTMYWWIVSAAALLVIVLGIHVTRVRENFNDSSSSSSSDVLVDAHEMIPRVDCNTSKQAVAGVKNVIDNRPEVIAIIKEIFMDPSINPTIQDILTPTVTNILKNKGVYDEDDYECAPFS